MEKIKYNDIVKFYKDKDATPIMTTKFLQEGLGQKSNGYCTVANVFRKEYPRKSKNQLFKESINKISSVSNELQTFFDFTDEEAKELINSVKIEKLINQKWHLYVSYIAFQELDTIYEWNFVSQVDKFKETPFRYYLNCNCPELVLWMTETARDDKNIKEKHILDLFDKAVEFKQSGSKQWRSNLWWKKQKEEYWNNIANIIELTKSN